MSDRLVLRFRPRCRVGCYDWEKDFPREVAIEVELAFDCRAAGRDDDLAKAFDYEPLGRRLVELAEGRHFQLVEALAEAVARLVVVDFQVPEVRVAVTKREAMPAMDEVVVEVRRAGADFAEGA